MKRAVERLVMWAGAVLLWFAGVAQAQLQPQQLVNPIRR